MSPVKRAALAAAALAAVVGHVWFWYWPRERPARPVRGDLPARMIAGPGWDACLWVPYPHQNLGALAAELDDPQSFFAAASRLAGSAEPALPAFGPFAVPPARELAACADESKNRLLVAARIYPGLAAVAKLAGKVAGNRWLAGGDVQVSGRPGRVRWERTLWTVSVGPAGEVEAHGDEVGDQGGPIDGPIDGPILAAFRLGRPTNSFPAGTYRLAHRDGIFDLTLEGSRFPTAVPFDPARLGGERPILLAVAGEDHSGSAAALALYDGGGLHGLPNGALLQPPKRSRWRVPGGGLAGLLSERLPHGSAAGWEIVALDERSLARARRLAPAISRLAPPDGVAAGGERPRFAVWLEPEPALGLVARMRSGLEHFPLAFPEDVQRWRDWETLLAPAARCQRATLWSGSTPDAFRIRLSGCG